MIDFSAKRTQLNQKIEAVKMSRKQQTDIDMLNCAHDWQAFRQTIRADNDNFTGTAFFIVKACIKCKTKKPQGYVVEL